MAYKPTGWKRPRRECGKKDEEHRRGGDRGKRRWGERERWTQGDREETEMKLITKTHMRLPKRLQIVIGATGYLRKDNF